MTYFVASCFDLDFVHVAAKQISYFLLVGSLHVISLGNLIHNRLDAALRKIHQHRKGTIVGLVARDLCIFQPRPIHVFKKIVLHTHRKIKIAFVNGGLLSIQETGSNQSADQATNRNKRSWYCEFCHVGKTLNRVSRNWTSTANDRAWNEFMDCTANCNRQIAIRT